MACVSQHFSLIAIIVSDTNEQFTPIIFNLKKRPACNAKKKVVTKPRNSILVRNKIIHLSHIDDLTSFLSSLSFSLRNMNEHIFLHNNSSEFKDVRKKMIEYKNKNREKYSMLKYFIFCKLLYCIHTHASMFFCLNNLIRFFFIFHFSLLCYLFCLSLNSHTLSLKIHANGKT